MKRDDVLKVDALKEELTTAFRTFEQSLRGVFGQLVYAIDEVIDRYNALETKHGRWANARTDTPLSAWIMRKGTSRVIAAGFHNESRAGTDHT